MPQWAVTRSNFRFRAGAVAVVLVGHVALLVLLATEREREDGPPADERITLVFIDPLEEPGPLPTEHAPGAARPTRLPVAGPRPEAEAAANESAAITPDIDWFANGSEAARRAAADPTTRDFGFPKREPPPREKQAFGWDKVHTERVRALKGGGIGIRLSDNCEIAFAPLPIGGCSLGKRKARGDLFDEMQAPVEPGDWK